MISIEKTGEHFRLLYDVKGRFVVHAITSEEAKYKLCKVRRVYTGPRGVPLLTTHDGRTIRYPDPLVKTHDTILVDIASGKIRQFIKFEPGALLPVSFLYSAKESCFIVQPLRICSTVKFTPAYIEQLFALKIIMCFD